MQSLIRLAVGPSRSDEDSESMACKKLAIFEIGAIANNSFVNCFKLAAIALTLRSTRSNFIAMAEVGLAALWADLVHWKLEEGTVVGGGCDNLDRTGGVLDIFALASMALVRDGDSTKIGNAGVAGDGSIDSARAALTFLAAERFVLVAFKEALASTFVQASASTTSGSETSVMLCSTPRLISEEWVPSSDDMLKDDKKKKRKANYLE